jgi:hypothetical protein
MIQDNPQAPAFSILSIASSVLSWISFMEAQYFLSFGVSIIGILSGIFAIRYYYYAGNQKRNQINNNNGE